MARLIPQTNGSGKFNAVEGNKVVAEGTLEVELIPTGTRHGSIQFITDEPYEPHQDASRAAREAENQRELARASA